MVAGRPGPAEGVGASSVRMPVATSSSASREAVDRVIPVAAATLARETGSEEAKTRPASSARFDVRRLDWRAEGAVPGAPFPAGARRDLGEEGGAGVLVLRATF